MWWRRGTRMPLPGVRLTPASLGVCVLLLASVAVAAVLVQAGLCGGGAWLGCVPGGGLSGGHTFGLRGKKSLSQWSTPADGEALVQLRRDVALTLLALATDLRMGRTEGVADQLEATANFLDPRYHNQGPPWSPPTITRPAYSPPPLNTPAKQQRNKTSDVSRDVYKGMGTHAKDWVPGRDELVGLNSAPPLSLDVQVTVLVDGCATPPNYLVGIVRQAVGTWPGVGVLVGVAEAQRAEVEDVNGLPGVQLLTVPCGAGENGALPDLVRATSTPYALVLSGVSAVTRDLNLPRLLSVAVGLRDQDVGVVGGSERGRDGAVDYTCMSLSVRNHVIEAKEGYRYSAAACLYCDVTSGSFLASVAVLRDVMPDPALPRAAQPLDWGLRLQRAGVLTLTCPDVMFHMTREVRGKIPAAKRQASEDRVCNTSEERKAARAAAWQSRRQYRKLAQKWEVSVVVLHNGTRLEYSCREVAIDCSPRQRTRHYSLPPCCMALKGRMLAAMDLVSREERIPYNINAGTLLGALKFHGPLPWDFDEDVLTEVNGINAFMRHTLRLRRLGLSLHSHEMNIKKSDANNSTTNTSHGSGSGSGDNSNSKNNNVKTTYATGSGPGGFSMDVWPSPHLPSHASLTTLAALPDHLPCLMHAHEPTAIREALAHPRNASFCHLASLIRVGGVWAPADWNPGHTALYKYGDGLYRHEAHWRWWSGDNWNACPRPGHHACLDLHPLDGSLPFL